MANKIADLLVSLGLDSKKFTSGVDKASGRLNKFKANLKNVAKGVGVAAAAGAAIAAKEATEAENVTMRMISTLKTIEGATVKTAEQFKKTASELQKVTTFGDDEIVSGMTDLLLITQDYNATIKMTSTLLDFAAGANMDLSTAARILGRVYAGDVTMLKRYGIIIDENATSTEALASISSRYFGQAENRAKTTAGGMKQLKNEFSDMAESAGNVGLGILNWAKGMATGDKTLKDFGASVKQTSNETENLSRLWELAIPSAVATGVESFEDAEEEIAELIEAQQRAQDTAVSIGETLSSTFGDAVATVLDGTATMTEKMTALLKTGLMSIIDIIGIQIKAQIAAATSTAITTGGLTSGQIAGHAAQLAIIEGLKAAVGTISLASGGIVSSPTAAIVGDNKVSPEVVAPLHKLQPMITKAVNQSMTNRMTFVINNNGGNGDDFVRRELAPALDRYFKKRGGNFYGA